MRKLSIKKETVVELSTQELAEVVGGSGVSCAQALCLPQSDFAECITGVRCLSLTNC
jgi:hypothetical protein